MNSQWKVDVSNSYVGFELRHLKISKLIGDFRKFSGCLIVTDDLANQLSNLFIKADVSSVNTRNSRRDKVLKSSNCLSVFDYPETHFASSTFLPIDKDHFLINGILKLKNCSKEVQFTAYAGGIAFDSTNHQKLGLELTAIISRKDFNLDTKFLAADKEETISDKVDLHLHLQFLKTSGNYGA